MTMKQRYQLYLLKVPKFEEASLPPAFASLPKSFDRDAFAAAREVQEIDEPILVAQSEVAEEIMAVEATLAKHGCRCLNVDAGSDFKRLIEQFKERFGASGRKRGLLSELMKHRDARHSDAKHEPKTLPRKELIAVAAALAVAVLLIAAVTLSRLFGGGGGADPTTAAAEVPERPNAWMVDSVTGRPVVNVNAAPANALQRLDGIDAATAAELIRRREQGEPFADLDDLQGIGGLDDTALARLRRSIVFSEEERAERSGLQGSFVVSRMLRSGLLDLQDRVPDVRQRGHVPGTGPVARHAVMLRERHDERIEALAGDDESVLPEGVQGFTSDEHGSALSDAFANLQERCDELATLDAETAISWLIADVDECSAQQNPDDCAAAVTALECSVAGSRIRSLQDARVRLVEELTGRLGDCLREEGVDPSPAIRRAFAIEAVRIAAGLPSAARRLGVADPVPSSSLEAVSCETLVELLEHDEPLIALANRSR
ncbi:MAG: helix-hairpin-helix domain-containing protein [Deltaproteobacteria bacterium]|nr:MAG: helix-hairpin-helix domain-containing protein [Deltaproteobacteria bacterium]